MSDEYIPMPQTPKRKYSGEYIGTVETGIHDNLMRVQVRVQELFGAAEDVLSEDLPWATYRLPAGSRASDGFFIPVKKGDLVWVDFPFNTDTRRPRITGSVHVCPIDANDTTRTPAPFLPNESWPTEAGRSTPYRTGLNDPLTPTASLSGGRGDLQKPPCVFKQNGVVVEILSDGTVRITNTNAADGGASGSNIEITKTGDIIIHSENSLFLSTKVNQENAIHGDTSITALGDKIQNVMGNVAENTKGQHSISGVKKVMITSDMTVVIKAPKVEIN
jgi:hypothetical protein